MQPPESATKVSVPAAAGPVAEVRLLAQTSQHILYDPACISMPDTQLFEPADVTAVKQAGRQAVYFVRIEGRQYVLRHYWRGGQAAKLSRDSYLWLGTERSRPFREWRLLAALQQRGLPVPRPAAARVERTGPLLYRGDILVEYLPDTRTLAELAARQPLPATLWGRIGATIFRFHRAGAWHADLNASNILIDAQERVFLIDWDRGQLRRPTSGWRRANLARLARSLAKFAGNETVFHYSENDWQALLLGYSRG